MVFLKQQSIGNKAEVPLIEQVCPDTQWNMINNALKKKQKNIYNTMLSKKFTKQYACSFPIYIIPKISQENMDDRAQIAVWFFLGRRCRYTSPDLT